MTYHEITAEHGICKRLLIDRVKKLNIKGTGKPINFTERDVFQILQCTPYKEDFKNHHRKIKIVGLYNGLKCKYAVSRELKIGREYVREAVEESYSGFITVASSMNERNYIEFINGHWDLFEDDEVIASTERGRNLYLLDLENISNLFFFRRDSAKKEKYKVKTVLKPDGEHLIHNRIIKIAALL